MLVVQVMPGLYIKSGHIANNEVPANWARLCIREDSPPCHQGDLLHINLPDDVPWSSNVVSQIVNFIESHLSEGISVLVECVAGVSRSPCAVLAYMMHLDSIPVDLALKGLQMIYPPADPSGQILDSLKDHFQVEDQGI